MATLSKDPIPNIRFNVAKGFGAALPNLRKFELTAIVNDVVIPRLNSMVEDGDGDVRFYAVQALAVGV
jgi:serine/threonine-protein phosphatase 2A regulatory subunit A